MESKEELNLIVNTLKTIYPDKFTHKILENKTDITELLNLLDNKLLPLFNDFIDRILEYFEFDSTFNSLVSIGEVNVIRYKDVIFFNILNNKTEYDTDNVSNSLNFIFTTFENFNYYNGYSDFNHYYIDRTDKFLAIHYRPRLID